MTDQTSERAETIGYAKRTIANIRREFLTRREKARRIKTILRLVRWGKP